MSWQFYLALVDSSQTTFGPEHHVKDLEVSTFDLTHSEGKKSTLALDLKNLHRGLISPGNEAWLWFSWDDGVTVRPLFFGRMLPMPSSMIREKINVLFRADRLDHVAQKAALAEALKVLPYYDPLFIDEQKRSDPDTALEGYSKLWHYDRVTGELTVSDIVEGEDGTEEFQESEVPFASVDSTNNGTPLTSIDVDATVNWTQAFAETIDVGSKTIQSYTADGILNDFPKPGAGIEGGYRVNSSAAVDVYRVSDTVTANWTYNYQNNQKEHITGDDLSVTKSQSKPVYRGPFLETILTIKEQVGLLDPFADPPINRPATSQISYLYVPLFHIQTSLVLEYNASRKRIEHLQFTLESDLQPVATDEDQTTVAAPLNVNGADVRVPIPDNSSAGSTAPLTDPQQRAYFTTERGIDSIKYLFCRARAFLRAGARIVELSFDCKFERAVNLSCRKNVLLHSRQLPGEQATGKIVGYSIKGNVGTGNFRGSVKALCAVGKGNSIDALDGVGTYVDPDVLDPGIQTVTGDVVLVSADEDVGFSTPNQAPNDDGLVFPLTRSDIVLSEGVTGSLAAQAAAIQAAFISEQIVAQLSSTPSATEQNSVETQAAIAAASANSVANALKNNPITLQYELRRLNEGAFTTEYVVEPTKLVVPKQYDTQAEALSA